MKKLILTLAMALGLFASANAAMIHLGNLTGQPADVGSETARLEQLISDYSLPLASGFSLNTPTLMGLTGFQTPALNSGLTSVTMNLNGFDGYLMLKWGNQDCFYRINDNLGTPFTSDNASYLGNSLYQFDSDTVAYNFDVNFGNGRVANSPGPNLGLSHYTQWGEVTPVPELGSTGLLMGFGLCGVMFFHRKTKTA